MMACVVLDDLWRLRAEIMCSQYSTEVCKKR